MMKCQNRKISHARPCLCSEQRPAQWMRSESDIVPGRLQRSRGSPTEDTPRPKHSITTGLTFNLPPLSGKLLFAWIIIKVLVCVRTQHERPSPQQTQQSTDSDSAKMSSTLLISCPMIILVCTATCVCVSVCLCAPLSGLYLCTADTCRVQVGPTRSQWTLRLICDLGCWREVGQKLKWKHITCWQWV